MANLTRVLQGEFYAGQVHAKIMDLPGPASYATGGVQLAASDAGVGHNLLGVVMIGIVAQNGTTSVFDAMYDFTTGGLRLIGSSGSEIPNATALTGGIYQILVFGY